MRVGDLRVRLLAAASPMLQDLVIAGENEERIAVLAWLNPAGCKELLEQGDQDLATLAENAAIQAHLRDILDAWNKENPTSSTRVSAMVLQDTPPSGDRNEITDKGYINQRAVLRNREQDVAVGLGRGPNHSRTIRL